MAQSQIESEGLEDSDSSFLQQVEMQKSTPHSPPAPVPIPRSQQNPLDIVSNAIPSTQPSYNHVSTVSQNFANERVNHISHSDNPSKDAKCKWMNILFILCISYSVIGVTYLLYATHFPNMSDNNNCKCVYQDSQQIASSESNTTLSPSHFPSISPWRPVSSTPTSSVYNLSSSILSMISLSFNKRSST